MAEVLGVESLSKPFATSLLNWKPQTISRDGTRALAVAYIDARSVAERFDQAVGPLHWTVDHKEVAGHTLTGIGVQDPRSGDWVWKWDTGLAEKEAEEARSFKGTLSDGLKRAAVLWGVGRYLYRLPKMWVAYDREKRRLRETPVLPDWARPAEERQPGIRTKVVPADGGSAASGDRVRAPG